MAKIIGDITWVPQPGYPKISGEENNETLTAKFVASVEALPENLPSYDSTYYDERWPFFNSFSHLVLASRSIEAMVGAKTVEITLVYSNPQFAEIDGETRVMKQVEYNSHSMDVPIEQHPKYKVCWNHSLLVKNDSGITTPIKGWESASAIQILPEAADKYKVLKYPDTVPDGWHIIAQAIKRGVEAFKAYVTEVHERRLSTNKNVLQSLAADNGTEQLPSDDFGCDGQWLQDGSSLKKEGRYWVLTTKYLNVKDIDNDIYD